MYFFNKKRNNQKPHTLHLARKKGAGAPTPGTGQGGQNIPGGKQVRDQDFTLGNRGLQLNKEYNLPLRVTRGYQVDKGPKKGYRYDGLYYVTDYERVEGKEAYQICRFHLQRENSTSEEEIEQPTSPADRAPHTVNRIVRNVKLLLAIIFYFTFIIITSLFHLMINLF